jgi:hypothetical protein
MAAWFLRDCPLVIDIGCGATPLQPWCSQPVTSISPDLPEGVAGFRGVVEDWQLTPQSEYGVCVLGCDLQSVASVRRVKQLLDSSSAAVIEAAMEYKPSVDSACRLMAGRLVRYAIDIDLSSVQMSLPSDSWPPRPHRRMWVL